MAPPAGTLRVGRYFLALLAVFAVLYGLVFLPGQRHTPKLGLDLEGGAQVIFKARTTDGKTPSKASMNEAKSILEQRVNGSGVANAEVVIQGADQIVVSIPGKTTKDLQSLGDAAQLNFRPLVMPVVQPAGAAAPTAAPTTAPSGGSTTSPAPAPSGAKASASPTSSRSAQGAGARPLNVAPTPTPSPTAAATPATKAAATPTPTASPATAPASCAGAKPGAKPSVDPLAGCAFPIPNSDTEFAKLTPAQQAELSAALAKFDCASSPPDDHKKPLLACDVAKTAVYLLGPVIVPGTEISSASALAPDGTNPWRVSLTLKTSGDKAWGDYTSKHNTGGQTAAAGVSNCGASTTPCADFVAFTLDGRVVSSPYNQNAIVGQATQISGSFSEKSARTLADQLKYGALPVNFTPQTNQNVSATLGTAQLKAGLLAGGIGLFLVVLYSLIYYRALGLVTIASLGVSAGLTYACLVILGREIGFTLTLAGIAGFIVAVGITADSFVVFFERIKDEVHEGRSMRVAVPRAWVRARRTILSADTVSFLAAAVLYYFAAGDVKGFAFTLGLSTVLDLVVVFLFTHPFVSLLSRSSAFGSARFTGLNAVRTGAILPDEVAAPGRRGERSAVTAGERAKPAKSVNPPKPTASTAPVVLLDKDEPVIEDRPASAEVPAAAAAGAEAPSAAAAEAAEAAESEPTRQPERPRPAAGGTAAERAAARRARMRAESAEKKGER